MRYLVMMDVSVMDIAEAEDAMEAVNKARVSGHLAWAIREDLAIELGMFDQATREAKP